MHLPVALTLEPPTRADLARAARSWRLWVAALTLALGAAGLWWLAAPRPDAAAAAGAPLSVVSSPAGASVWIDGRERGRTPLTVPVPPGTHALVLRRDDRIEARYDLDVPAAGAGVDARLWRRQPLAQRLRPTFPGAAIAAADFVADGRVALTVALPTNDERQLWLLDPATGGLERVGPPDARAGLAVSPDGRAVAYLARGAASGPPVGGQERLDELWTAPVGAARGERRWRLAAPDERLADLSWAPDGAHLLLVTVGRPANGATRSRLLRLDPGTGEVRELVALPSEVVPASYAWSPDGRRVAFLVRSGQLTALCLVGADGSFRYLADLSRDDPHPLAPPPLAWSPDGRRLLYAAATQERSAQAGWLFGPRPSSGLFATEADRGVGERLGDAEGQAPAWPAEGAFLALARPRSDGALVLRRVDPDGRTEDLADLPLKAPAVYAARWDLAHAQALVAVRGAAAFGASRPDYWLLRFAPAETDR